MSSKRPHSLAVTNAGVAVYPPGATFGPRKMKDFEFVWIIEGDAVAVYDERRIEAPAGTILLCRPGMTDAYEWARKRPTIHAFFHFDLGPTPGHWPPVDSWPLAHRLAHDDILRPLFRYVLRLHALPEPMRSAQLTPVVEVMLMSFISGKFALAAEPHAEMPPAVERALALIRDLVSQQPSPAVNLSQLARAANVTPEHLCRLFRQSLDLAPLECVRLARLERAATLLARSNLAIKQITEATGWANPYHFSRRFTAVYGISPRAYRKAVREGETVRANPVSKALLLNLPARLP
jgi:AraC family transcriptional regulator